ncbi:MAG: hypothetical protein QXM75_04385 [Candidatus Diapherotrites archaeon]
MDYKLSPTTLTLFLECKIKNNPLCSGCKLFSDKEKLREWEMYEKVCNIGIFQNRGFCTKDDSVSFYELQLDIYNLLLIKNGYITEDFGHLLFYYPKEVKGLVKSRAWSYKS